MDDWQRDNLANWDRMVALHLAAPDYDLSALRAGTGRMNAIEEAELWPVAGLDVLHLQCHFGRDSLTLAQRGARVTGLDFSPAAIAAATALAAELGLSARARFVQGDLYDAPRLIPGRFDLVYVTWGAIPWLPDITAWAQVVAGFLRPGGALYLAEAHPAALVLDDLAGTDGRPGWFAPYLGRQRITVPAPTDYVAEGQTLPAPEHTWLHPLSDVLNALTAAGLRLAWLHEHDAVTWRMFDCLVEGPDGLFRWPDRPWWPLSYSLRAESPEDRP